MSKKLEHHMLLDAKKVEDLGLWDYLWMATRVTTLAEIEKIHGELIEDLAACDVSALYEGKKDDDE